VYKELLYLPHLDTLLIFCCILLPALSLFVYLHMYTLYQSCPKSAEQTPGVVDHHYCVYFLKIRHSVLQPTYNPPGIYVVFSCHSNLSFPYLLCLVVL
jgi:hypothetical protein